MSLKNSDTSTLSDIVKVDGERVKEKNLESLVEYYSNGNNKIDTLITNLKNNNETKDFKLQSKKYFFWNMYYLDVKTFNIKIKSNFEEGNFILGNSGKVKAGETIKNVIPGNYKITGSLNSNYEEIKTSKEIVVMEDKEIELNFPATKITINSDFQDAEVYINGKDIKKEVKDLKDFGPVPTDGKSFSK